VRKAGITVTSPKQKTEKSLHDFVTNLDEAKSVQRQDVILRIIKSLFTLMSLAFICMMASYLFLSIKNNQVPNFQSVLEIFSAMLKILNIAMGIST
jgi:hypothetical protein